MTCLGTWLMTATELGQGYTESERGNEEGLKIPGAREVMLSPIEIPKVAGHAKGNSYTVR